MTYINRGNIFSLQKKRIRQNSKKNVMIRNANTTKKLAQLAKEMQ